MQEPISPFNQKSFWRGVIIDFLVITCLWGIAILFVNPSGNFPLNDDWAYGMTVKRFLVEKSFHPPGWPGMTLISQTLWGVAVSILFGFSYQTLHLSILFLSLLLLFCVYLVVREFSHRRWHALAVSLTLAFNPMYFSHSFTFMTEIPFMFFVTLTFWAFIRTLKSDSLLYLFLGTLFATVSILCRQIGLFVPIAFGLVYLLKHKPSGRSLFWAGFPAVVGLAVLTGFQKWMQAAGKLPMSYNMVIDELIDNVFHHPKTLLYAIPRNIFFTVQYLGFFLLPLLLLFFPIHFEKKRIDKVVAVLLLLYAIACMSVSFIFGYTMPFFTKFESILIKEGLGPLTLNDTFIRHLPNLPSLPDVLWKLITLLSIAGGVLLLASLVSICIRVVSGIRSLQQDDARLFEIFFILSAVIYISPLLVSRIFFDRYLIPLFLPFAFLVVQARTERFNSRRMIIQGISALLIGFFAVFSTLLTHDYLGWNRTRWVALDYLMNEKGIAPTRIDGGFEFNGLYLYNEDQPIDDTTSEKSWWWVQDDLYTVTFGEVPGYDVFQRFSCDRWYPRTGGQILILKRKEQPSTPE